MPARRNSSLDLLRCLAILMVLACHLTPTSQEPWLLVLKLGGKGVDLFFVLSGWLLGEQLLREVHDTGSIDLRRFWSRRWLRTLPAYYTVLGLSGAWLFCTGKLTSTIGYYLVFGQTYLTRMPWFGVSWSLCVEEHFYLAVAPAVLLFFRRRWSLVFLPFLLAAPVVCRCLGWYTDLTQTHVRYDQCAVGVLLAAAKVFAPGLWRRLCRLAPLLAGAGAVAVVGVVYARVTRSFIPDIDPLAWALIFASFVLLANSGEVWLGVFRFPGVRYLADRSYAAYLLHLEVMALLHRVEWIPYPLYCALVLVLTLASAEILYRLVERPLIRLRERFSSIRSREAGQHGPAEPPGGSPKPAISCRKMSEQGLLLSCSESGANTAVRLASAADPLHASEVVLIVRSPRP